MGHTNCSYNDVWLLVVVWMTEPKILLVIHAQLFNDEAFKLAAYVLCGVF